MRILLMTLLCLLLTLPCFADQQTTVLEERLTLGKAEVVLPAIDGSNDEELEKQANKLIRDTASALAKEVGGGRVTYRVLLNRPSLVSLLLEAENGGKHAFQGLNLDLTTGREFVVGDFFVDNDEVKQALGDYTQVLFAEEGIYYRTARKGAYESFVPYARVLNSLRIGEAGRLMQVTRLTRAAAGKTLKLDKPGLAALKLDANPATGYGWELSCASPYITKVGSSFTIPRQEQARMGTPGVEILFINIQQPGTYTVKMNYKRSWERINLDSFSFTVNVKGN